MFLPQNLVSDRPPYQSLLRIALNVILGFVIVGPLLGLAVASMVYSGDLLGDIQRSSGEDGFVSAILLMQGIVTFVGLIFFPVLHLTLLEHKRLEPFFPLKQQTLLIVLLVAVIGVAFPVSISPLAEWNLNIKFPEFMHAFETWALQEEERLGKLTEIITDFRSTGALLTGIIAVALLPAIGEEFVFRGLIQRELWRATGNGHVAIWVSAAIFSAIHMQFYGFVPRMLLGALFGYLYYWSGNLLIPMFSHFFNNAFALIMVHLHHMEITSINVEDGEAMPWPYVTLSAVLTASLLYYIWRHYAEPPDTDRHYLANGRSNI